MRNSANTGSMHREWNALLTGKAVTRISRDLKSSVALSAASILPDNTVWLGWFIPAISIAILDSSKMSCAVLTSVPRINIFPSGAFSIISPRAQISLSASFKLIQPAKVAATYSPTLCPNT